MQFDPFALASSDSIAIAATLLAGLAVLYNALLFTVKFGTSTAHRLILVVLVVAFSWPSIGRLGSLRDLGKPSKADIDEVEPLLVSEARES